MTLHLTFVFLLLIQLPLVAWRLTAGQGIARTGAQMMGFTVGCEIVFWLYATGVLIPDGPCSYGAETEIPVRALLTFSAMFGVFCLADMASSHQGRVLSRSHDQFIGLLLNAGRYMPLVAAVGLIYVPTYVATRDLGVMWHNNQYLLMSSPDTLKYPGPFSAVLNSVRELAYFALCISLAIALVVRRHGAAAVIFFCVLALFVISVSGASRSGPVGIFLFCITYSLLNKRIRPAIVGLFLFGIYVLQAVLIGRGNGEFGVAHFWAILVAPFSDGLDPTVLIANVFQGALSTADGFLVAGEASNNYRWLSISPFPSFIDGFEDIRRSGELRLHRFCPMSAATEVVRFGPTFWILVTAQYVGMVAFINSRHATNRVGMLWILSANIIFTTFTIVGFAYPLRNVLRPMTYTFLFILIYSFFAAPRPKRQNRAGRRSLPPNVPMQSRRATRPMRGRHD